MRIVGLSGRGLASRGQAVHQHFPSIVSEGVGECDSESGDEVPAFRALFWHWESLKGDFHLRVRLDDFREVYGDFLSGEGGYVTACST